MAIDSYNRWFNVYLAVASAAIVVLVPLTQTLTSGNQPTIVNITLLGLLVLGVANFVGLSFSTAISIQYERAMLLIQDYFIEREPNKTKLLHFRTRRIGVPGTGFRALIIRGLTDGSPKSMLVLTNSIVISVLTVKIGVESGVIQPDSLIQVIMAIVTFVLGATLHLLYSRIVYKMHGV